MLPLKPLSFRPLSCAVFILLVSVSGSLSKEPKTVASTVAEVAKNAKPSIAVITFRGRDGKQRGLGTGFVISSDGLIATNLHVIGQARPISVQLADGRKYDVESVHASDRFFDLAIIKIDANDLPALKLGSAAGLQQGAPVVVMGNPHGLKHSVVSGVASGIREIDDRRMIQLAMPIEPGNSGGPVLDMQGRVIGIVTMKSLVTNNLGFAIQIDSLKPLMKTPNPIPMQRWLTIGQLDPQQWEPLFGARWQQRAGRIYVAGAGQGFGGRSLCLWHNSSPKLPFEVSVAVKLDDESGAAGLLFHSDGGNKHYGFYPTAGKLRLTRFEGPNVFTWKVLRDVQSEHYQAGKWNYLKVRVEKDKILCYVNGHLVIESTDNVLKPGKVGLAKFRQTKAEFKRFHSAEQVPTYQISPEAAARINLLIDGLPALDSVQADQLLPLIENSTASVEVLRARAAKLQRRAQELEKIAGDIHVKKVAAQLAKRLSVDDSQADLLRATLDIALLDNEDVEIESYVAQVNRMAGEVKKKLPPKAGDADRLKALNEYLFTENGFHGSRTNYYHHANSYLNQVIDDREGLPITLSVLYMELGRRIGLTIEGISLPGHFIVKHVEKDGSEQLIDVFQGGKPMTRQDAQRQVRISVERDLTDDDLHATSKKDIVLRMLRNLQSIAQGEEDREAILRYLEASVAIQPDSVPDRGMRAVTRFETGRRDAAIADLDWFLENEPDGLDLNQIRKMRNVFQQAPKP